VGGHLTHLVATMLLVSSDISSKLSRSNSQGGTGIAETPSVDELLSSLRGRKTALVPPLCGRIRRVTSEPLRTFYHAATQLIWRKFDGRQIVLPCVPDRRAHRC
jgi:hypothetical protein